MDPLISELLLCEHPDCFNHYVIKKYVIPSRCYHIWSYLPRVRSNLANTDRKRKRVVLSIESKLSVLDSVAKGVSYSKLTEKFGIGSLL